QVVAEGWAVRFTLALLLCLLTSTPQVVLLLNTHRALDLFEEVRRTITQLCHERASHMPDVEGTTAVRDLRVEEDLQQHVRKLLAEVLLSPLWHLAITIAIIFAPYGGEILPQFDSARLLLGLFPHVGHEVGVAHGLLPLALALLASHQRHGVLALVHDGFRHLG